MLKLLVASHEVSKPNTAFAGEIVEAPDFHAAIEALEQHVFDIAFVDLEIGGRSGSYLLQHIAAASPATFVAVMAGKETFEGLASRPLPASVILRKPVHEASLIAVLNHLTESRQPAPRGNGHSLIGMSSGIRKIRKSIAALKDWVHPILIVGETGTGKEVIAAALHKANTARRGPLVTVDCGAVSPTLIENELFGHAKGAYTGAGTAQRGLLQAADGGTIFFDEIGDLPLECQSRLLRVLQEREIRPLGETSPIPIDVRVCAATNVDLEEAVQQKRFRQDLYYRLSAVTIKVPPLRDRREDIPLLANHFLHWSGNGSQLSIDAHLRMMEYEWPGNVRELQNRLLRATTLADGPLLSGRDLLGRNGNGHMQTKMGPGRLQEVEKQEILRAVAETNNDVIAAARILGIGKTTLYRKLRAYREG